MKQARSPFEPSFFEHDPLFWPIAPAARAFVEYTEWPPVSDYGPRLAGAALSAGVPPVDFRESPPKPRRRRSRRHETGPLDPRDLYDGHIVEEGWVPTRPESWHDFLNMLVWATFPQAKRRLHARQHRAISARLAAPDGGSRVRPGTLPNARTPEQDALALLDEGGVVIACSPDLATSLRSALRERREEEATRAFASGAARAVVFGHALFEGLVLRREAGWGAARFLAFDSDLSDDLALVRAADAALSATLDEEGSLRSTADLSRADLRLIRPG